MGVPRLRLPSYPIDVGAESPEFPELRIKTRKVRNELYIGPKRINNHLIMYKIDPRVLLLREAVGERFWHVVGLTCKIPWPEFEYGGYSVTFWIKRVGLGYI